MGIEVTRNLTARYEKIDSGYLGQLVEWPEVVTERKTFEACRESLKDALEEMLAAYKELGKEVPHGQVGVETKF